MLVIGHPENNIKERKWVLGVVFSEFLGIEYVAKVHHKSCTTITMESRVLELSDDFFQRVKNNWLSPLSMPKTPLKSWDSRIVDLNFNLVKHSIPVIYGDNAIEIANNRIKVAIDILGSTFFMLSRYEEVVMPDRDQHDRFPGTASIAFRENFLTRPIVNEYVEILWVCLRFLWPNLRRKPRQFQTRVTCDVDHPYSPSARSLRKQVLQIGENVVIRKNLRLGAVNGLNFILRKVGNYRFDLCNCFDWMMSVCEREGVVNAFYFITAHLDKKYDGHYSMNDPFIRKLLCSMHDRGHEIGLHTSYNTYLDFKQTKREYDTLLKICEEEEIIQDKWGGRQHYLRWKTPETFQNWDRAGLDYDSTLGFADQAGFRCGVCYEYNVYDVIKREPLNLIERPLIVMESTIISERYMNLGYSDKALEQFLFFKDSCRRFNGDFTFLWHNSFFNSSHDRLFYKAILAY